MVQRVIPFTAKKAGTAPLVESVVARSDLNRKRSEDAWVSMAMAGNDHVMVVEFKAEDYGDEAFSRAVKYGKQLAERLGVGFRKKRGANVKVS